MKQAHQYRLLFLDTAILVMSLVKNAFWWYAGLTRSACGLCGLEQLLGKRMFVTCPAQVLETETP